MRISRLYILSLILLLSSFPGLRASVEADPGHLYRDLKEKSGLEKAMTEAGLAVHYFECCPDSVIRYSRILDRYGNRFNDRMLDAFRHRIKGNIAYYKLQFDSALYYDTRALELFRDEGDTLQMGWVTNSIGTTYFQLGNYEKASDSYMQALSYFESSGNREGIALTLNGLGNACYYVEKYDMALEYYESSLKIYDELGNDSEKIKMYNNLASIEYSKKEYSGALEYFFLAAEGFEKNEDFKTLSVVLSNIALCYHYMNKNQEALEYIRKSLDYATRENDISRIIHSKLNFGFILSSQGHFKEAARHFQEGMDLAKEYGLTPMVEQIYVEFAEMYALSGDFEQAYLHRLKYDSLHFETLSQRTQERIDELNLTYKTQQKENEIKQLKAEKVIQKKINIIYLVLIISITVILLILFFGYRAKRKLTSLLEDKNRQLLEYNDRLQENEQELREIIDAKNKLFSIVAHDLRDPISSVIGFSELLSENLHSLDKPTLEKYATQIREGALMTNALLENLLLWARSQMNVLKVNISEVRIDKLIRDSMDTLAISLEKKNIDFEMKCDEKLTASIDGQMIKVVIRNLLSNAVKFTYPGGKVGIHAFRDKESAVVEVSDTGIGMDEKMLQEIFSSGIITSSQGTAGEKGTGLGLLLCREYTEKNNGNLTVKSEPGAGTTFRLALPVKSSQ